jgi:carboxymethylenebutenolidase
MADDYKNQKNNDELLPRRGFVALSVAAGLAVSAVSAEAAVEVVETDVDIKTPDGTCDAAFFHPKSGSHAGVLIWPDAFGLRPSLRAMGKRLAAEGYSVLVPNPFYRVAKNPFTDASNVDFAKEGAKIQPLMASVNAPGNAEKDAVAYVAFLDAQKQVDKKRKIGTQGYCMGGPLVVRTAATVPDRIGAGGSFHGGNLVNDQPASPHLLAPKIKAKMLFAIAESDDKRQPDARDKLKAAFPEAAVQVFVGTIHGWCISDMPKTGGMPTYSMPDAEQAWSELLELYKTALA